MPRSCGDKTTSKRAEDESETDHVMVEYSPHPHPTEHRKQTKFLCLSSILYSVHQWGYSNLCHVFLSCAALRDAVQQLKQLEVSGCHFQNDIPVVGTCEPVAFTDCGRRNTGAVGCLSSSFG